MSLDAISFGKINSHLDRLFAGLESVLAASERELAQSLDTIHEDPVYRSIAGGFPMPVASSPSSERLRQRISSISEKAGARRSILKAFLDAVERFLESHPSRWPDQGYFIVPVMAESGQSRDAGMVYLQAVPRLLVTEKLHIEDLTRDRNLLTATKDYFGKIASALMKTVYYVQIPPFELYDTLTHYTYRLQFGCQITEGKSIGAAALATFALVHFQTMLGEQFHNVVAPRCGTFLTGEVDVDGRVHQVEDAAEKVACALEEFGPDLRFILPNENRLPLYLEQRIAPGNLHYVNTAEELLAAVFSSADDFRGLDQARAALFRLLSPVQRSTLRKLIIPGIASDVYEKMAEKRGAWTTPRRQEGGVYALSTAWRDRLDIRLSLELSGLQEANESNGGREMVEIILDGSEQMSEHWITDQTTGVCRMTTALFEIDRRINPDAQDLVCGFLSHQEFYTVRHGMLASEIEALIQKIRREHRLEHRGPFFRPVYESSLRKYHDRLKRVYILSDHRAPDLDDLKEPNLSSLKHLRLLTEGEEEAVALFEEGGKLSPSTLDRYFQRERGTISEIQIDLGDELPVEWEPAEGTLDMEEESFIFRFKVDDLRSEVRIRLANQHPHSFKISGRILRDDGPASFSFVEHPTLSALAPLHSPDVIRLTDEEFEAWLRFETPGWRCPSCGSSESHLLDAPEGRFRERIVFESLRHLSDGYVLMRKGAAESIFFRTGCQVSGLSFVVISGSLYWSQTRGRVAEVPYENGFYCLRTGSDVFYLCRV
ncbi:MAG: hypothetical protein AB1631_12775 [Acidobacteriota bacterium]